MKLELRWVRQLPLATAAGVAFGVLGALIAAVISVLPVGQTAHPLRPFALAVVPTVAAVWIDWARLWRPSRARRRYRGLLQDPPGRSCCAPGPE